MKAPIGFKTAEPAQTDGIVDLFYKPLIAAGIAPSPRPNRTLVLSFQL